MKKGMFILVLITLFCGLSYGQEMRVAHVDSKLIMEKYNDIQQAQQDYESQLAIWEQKANILNKELNAIRQRLDKQSLILSDEKKAELSAKLSEKESELKEFTDKIYGPEGELVNENKKISEPLILKMKNAIYEIALQEGYDYVLDRSSGSVLFWKDENDLTQKVIDQLNGKVQ